MALRPLKNPYLTGLASLQTGVLLMVALALASIFGTLFKYETSLKIVFYAWWFRLLLLFLAANLVLCTYQTLAKRVLPSFRPPFPKSREFYENGPLRFAVETSHSADEIESLLRGRGWRLARDGPYIRARKGRFRPLAAPLAHLGFIIMLLGAFASGFLAFNGQVTLTEGQSMDRMLIGGERPAVRDLGFRLRCLDFETGTFPQTQIPSRFVSTVEIRDGEARFLDTVEVNKSLKWRGLKFHQSGYEKVSDGGRLRVRVADTAASKSVETAVTAGLSAPLADWDREVFLEQTIAGTRYDVLRASEVVDAGLIARDVAGLELKALRFLPDFMIDGDGEAVSRSDQMNNPALEVAWVRDGEILSKPWLFHRRELRGFSHGKHEEVRLEFTRAGRGADGEIVFGLEAYERDSDAHLGSIELRLDEAVRLADLTEHRHDSDPTSATAAAMAESGRYDLIVLGRETLYETVLAVSHNPMIPAIYFGSILACAAVCFALYMRRTTLWVLCRAEERRALVVVQYQPERLSVTLGVEKTLAALK